MKRRNRQSQKSKPGHVRAIEALLVVCEMGLNAPGDSDSDERIAYSLLVDVIQKTRKEWGEAGPLAALADKPEAASYAGAR